MSSAATTNSVSSFFSNISQLEMADDAVPADATAATASLANVPAPLVPASLAERAAIKAAEKAAHQAAVDRRAAYRAAIKAEKAAKMAAEKAEKAAKKAAHKEAVKKNAAEKAAANKAAKIAFQSNQIKPKLFEENEECQICYEPLNKSSNKPVVCPFSSCAYKACVSCIRTYLLGNPQSAPHCMSCKKPFDNLYLVQNLTKVWTNDKYYTTIYNTLTEMELARLSEAMEEAEIRKKAANKAKELREEIKKIAETVFYPGREVECSFSYLPNWTIARVHAVEFYEDYDYYTRIKFTSTNASWALGNHRRGVRSCHNDFDVDVAIDTIIQLENELSEQQRIALGLSQTKPKERKVFTMPCSYNECKGMLSTEYKCGICDKYTCKDCHEPLEDEHKCNPDTVATKKAILKDTRPCPSCNARIFKIEGCDQMWCTSCKTPFSWTTGQIVPSGQRLHNPHAIEYMRLTGNTVRAPGDLVCGGVITIEQFRQLKLNVNNMLPYLLSFNKSNPGKLQEALQCGEIKNKYMQNTLINKVTNLILCAWRIVDQVSRNKLREAREAAQAHRNFNEERVQFILNQIDKNEFTGRVAYHNKEKKVQMDMSHIWELVSNFGIDMLNALYNASVCDNIVSMIAFLKFAFQKTREFDSLVKYANTQLAVVSVSHSVSVPTMNIENTNYDDVFKQERYSQIALKIMLAQQ